MRLLHTVAVGLLGLGASASWSASNSTNEPSLHNEDSDLICHTWNLDECYPKHFVATNEFQVLHDDQAIPKGLHIRMNMQTGEKEAKLYDPTTDTDPGNAVEVLPDEPLRDETPGMHGNIQEQAQQVVEEMRKAKAARAESVKVPIGASGDREIFDRNVQIVQDYERLSSNVERDQAIDRVSAALDELQELCHDIYWGKELAKVMPSPPEKINQDLETDEYTTEGHFSSLRSKLLATALRNNAAALDSLEEWEEKKDRSDVANLLPNHLHWALGNVAKYSRNATTISRSISLISAMLPRESFLMDFLSSHGLSELHKAVRSNDQFARGDLAPYPTKEGKRLVSRLKDLMEDYFLSENFKVQMEAWAQGIEKVFTAAGTYSERGSRRSSKAQLDIFCVELEAAADMLRAGYWEQYYPEVTRSEVPSWFKPKVCDYWEMATEAVESSNWEGRDEL